MSKWINDWFSITNTWIVDAGYYIPEWFYSDNKDYEDLNICFRPNVSHKHLFEGEPDIIFAGAEIDG